MLGKPRPGIHFLFRTWKHYTQCSESTSGLDFWHREDPSKHVWSHLAPHTKDLMPHTGIWSQHLLVICSLTERSWCYCPSKSFPFIHTDAVGFLLFPHWYSQEMCRFSQRHTDLPGVQRGVMRCGLTEKLELLQTMQCMEIGSGAGYTVGLRTSWVLQSKNCLIKEEMAEICATVGDQGGKCREQDLWNGNRFWENE